ncbi:MAG TPA: metallophosphoesterase [Nitrospira sp.]|nr:metallophosphoesterase [Nitrospira sp.]
MERLLFVVSDLHLGGAPGGNDHPGFQMCTAAGRARLAAFIEFVTSQRGTHQDIHLVLAGDIVDFLAEEDFAAFTDDQQARQKLERILQRTDEVWSSLEGLVRSGARLTLLLGNHDIELSLPGPRRLLLDRLGGGRIEFIYDNQAYVEGPVLIEHGNRYDAWNVVSHDGLREVRSALSRGEPPPAFESPAGSHLVCEVMNRLKSQYPFVDLLKPEDAGLLPLLAVLAPSCMSDIVKIVPMWRKQAQVEFDEAGLPLDAANIAAAQSHDEAMIALAQDLAYGDTASVGAFEELKGIIELWRVRNSKEDDTRQLQRLYRALRARAESTWQAFDVNRESDVYLNPARASAARGFKVVVFGHTHLVKRVALQDGSLYLNTGTWADLMQVPKAVLTGDEAEGHRQLAEFLDALKANRLSPWRRQVPTFGRIEFAGDTLTSADVFFFDAPGQVERVPDGCLTRLSS